MILHVHRSASTPKKISSAEHDFIILAQAAKGNIRAIATCKLLTAFLLDESNLKIYAKKFNIKDSVAGLRQRVGAKQGNSVSCVVVYNVIRKEFLQVHECKLRAGWGYGRLPTDYQPITSCMIKKDSKASAEASASSSDNKSRACDENNNTALIPAASDLDEQAGDMAAFEDVKLNNP